MSLIKVKNLKKQFQIGSEIVYAIKDISFNVDAGEFISIMGPSGSGSNIELFDKSSGLRTQRKMSCS